MSQIHDALIELVNYHRGVCTGDISPTKARHDLSKIRRKLCVLERDLFEAVVEILDGYKVELNRRDPSDKTQRR